MPRAHSTSPGRLAEPLLMRMDWVLLVSQCHTLVRLVHPQRRQVSGRPLCQFAHRIVRGLHSGIGETVDLVLCTQVVVENTVG